MLQQCMRLLAGTGASVACLPALLAWPFCLNNKAAKSMQQFFILRSVACSLSLGLLVSRSPHTHVYYVVHFMAVDMRHGFCFIIFQHFIFCILFFRARSTLCFARLGRHAVREKSIKNSSNN